MPMTLKSGSPCVFQGNGSESEEDRSVDSMENQALPSTHRVPDSKLHSVHTKMDVIKKGHAKDSQRYKVDYESQSTDTQNFSSESKRETEYVRVFPLPNGGVGCTWPGRPEIMGSLLTQEPLGVPTMAQQVKDPPSTREDAGSILGLTQ